jgi:hypothetical protein
MSGSKNHLTYSCEMVYLLLCAMQQLHAILCVPPTTVEGRQMIGVICHLPFLGCHDLKRLGMPEYDDLLRVSLSTLGRFLSFRHFPGTLWFPLSSCARQTF